MRRAVGGGGLERAVEAHPGSLGGGHHQVGPGQCIGVAVGFENVVDSVHRLDLAAHDGDPTVPRLQETHERLGDAPAPEDRHVAVHQQRKGHAQ